MAKKEKNYKSSFTMIEEAYKKIKTMIFRQNMVGGQRLVGKDLSEKLHMSRTPIINALFLLEREGFVIFKPYHGFYVKPADIQETIDLFEVREALEVMAVQLAIERMEDGAVGPLEAIAKRHAEYMPGIYDRQKVALGVEFHLQIARMSKNKKILQLLKTNLEYEYTRYTYKYADITRMEPAFEEHYEIIDAIRNKDITKSIELIRLHVQKNKNHVINTLKEQKKIEEKLWHDTDLEI